MIKGEGAGERETEREKQKEGEREGGRQKKYKTETNCLNRYANKQVTM